METRVITRVNNVDILALSENQYIPIKPICEALGIDPEAQRQKINSHYLLGKTALLSKVVAADKKEREMFCLPIGYIFGWLMTINPSNVNDDAKESLKAYQEECYAVLLRYFLAKAEFLEQNQLEIDKQLEFVNNTKCEFNRVKSELSQAENKLKKLREMTMDDYDMERRQLKIDFK